METKKSGRLLALMVVVILVIGFIFTSGSPKTPSEIEDNSPVQAQVENVKLTVEGTAGENSLSLSVGDTVLDILKKLNSQSPELQLTVKEYAGMGVLVEGMNGKNNGTENKYWQYEVNGTSPQIGADKLELNDGDIIRWHFSESEF